MILVSGTVDLTTHNLIIYLKELELRHYIHHHDYIYFIVFVCIYMRAFCLILYVYALYFNHLIACLLETELVHL